MWDLLWSSLYAAAVLLELQQTSGGRANRLAWSYAAMEFIGSFTFSLLATVRILHLENIGLRAGAIGALMACYSVLTGLVEVPSGAAADVFGRRATKLVSLLCYAAAATTFALATGLVAAAGALFCLALGRALGSGTLDSWFVDEIGDAEHPAVVTGLAAAEAAGSIGMAVGALLGGLIPWLADGTRRGFVLVFVLVLVEVLVDAMLTIATMTETVRPQRTDRSGLAATTWAGVSAAVVSPVGRSVLAASLALGAMNAAVELLAPLELRRGLGVDRAALWFGVIVALSWLGTAVASARTPALERLVGSAGRAAALMALVLAGAGIAVLAGWAGPAASFVVVNLAAGPLLVLLNLLMHRVVDSAHRTTAVSALNLAFMAGAATGAALVAVGGRWAVVPPCLLALGAGVGLLRLGRLAPLATGAEETRQPSETAI